MSPRPIMLDLCCGLGGVWRRFEAAGWRTISVDIEHWVRPTIVCDVRRLAICGDLRPDFIWASEPCTQYSRLARPGLYPNEPEPDLSIALAIADIVRWFDPPKFVIENVWGARRYYGPIFGQVRAMVPGHAFWGSLFLIPQVKGHKHSVGQQTNECIRKAKRAIIPAPIVDSIIAQLGRQMAFSIKALT